MAKEFDLLVVGEINPDLVIHGQDVIPEFGQAEKLVEGALLTIGSSSAIAACGAARLGLRVAFIGVVGDDQLGRFMLEALAERGIDVSACLVDKAAATGISVILSGPDDRAILTYPGTMPLLRAGQIDEAMLRKARHLHLGGYFLLDALRPDLPGLFARAKELGLSTSLDTNWDPSGRWEEVAALLPYVDIFLPNENEVLQITAEEEFGPAMDRLAMQVPTVAVKQGALGGLARQGESSVTATALAVDVVDTTGAGDSFDAGFLYGSLNAYALKDALALACACGSLSTRSAGGTDAQPVLDEALAALAQQGEESL